MEETIMLISDKINTFNEIQSKMLDGKYIR